MVRILTVEAPGFCRYNVHMFRVKLLLFAALLAAWGCSAAPATPDPGLPVPESDLEAPTVVAVEPGGGSKEVSVAAGIRVSFSEAMDPLSVSPVSFALRKGGPPVMGELKPEGAQILFQPKTTLDYNSSYQVSLGAGLTDLAGNPLANPMEISFSTQTFSSNLPIILIDTQGQAIPDEPKVPARMQIIAQEGERNFLTDLPGHYDGWIGIETRGTLSQTYPKKQYGMETRDEAGEDINFPLLGLPDESDWILQGSYLDRSFVRNLLPFELSRQLGRYASRVRFAELFLNQRGDGDPTHEYLGLYLLLEKIKRDGERVDIAKLSPNQNSEPEISGGYILEIDRFKPGDKFFTTERGTLFIHVYPDGDDISEAQQEWIKNYLSEFEAALEGEDFQDPDLGYAAYLDVEAFVDYLLLNELFRNPDAFSFSTFVHKDRAGKLVIGPVWDFDLAMGNDRINGAFSPTGWQLLESRWVARLMQDSVFVDAFIQRYQELRGGVLSLDNLFALIDGALAQIDEAQGRNFLKWPILDSNAYPFPLRIPGTYSAEIELLREWLAVRTEWIDAQVESLGSD